MTPTERECFRRVRRAMRGDLRVPDASRERSQQLVPGTSRIVRLEPETCIWKEGASDVSQRFNQALVAAMPRSTLTRFALLLSLVIAVASAGNASIRLI